MTLKAIAKICLVAVLFISLIAGVSAQTPQFTESVTITAGTSEQVLIFGTHTDGTDGYDQDLDVGAPPAPPTVIFDAVFRIQHADFSRLYTDIRGILDAENPEGQWRMQVTSKESDAVLSWDRTTLPDDIDFTLTYSGVAYDMKSVGTLTVSQDEWDSQTVLIKGEYNPASGLEIVSVAAIADIPVAYGTPFAELGLPTQVTAILNDASERDVDVDWAEGDYDPTNPGTYTLEGTLVNLPAGVTNPDDVKAEVDVIVDIERFTVTFNVTEALQPDEGEPVAGAEVVFNGETKLTDEQGHVLFTDVPVGTYDWSVEKLMYLREEGKQLVQGDTHIDVALYRHVEVYNVYFTVTDVDEEPIEGARVRIAGGLIGEQEGTTDADGFVVFSGIPPGGYEYRISAAGYLPDVGTFEIVDSMIEIDIMLEAGLPATIMAGNPVIPTGMNRTTGVFVANVENMTSVGVNLTFNTELAEVTLVQANASVTSYIEQFKYSIDNTTGRVTVAMVLNQGLDAGVDPTQVLDLTIDARQTPGSDWVEIVFSEYTIGSDFQNPYFFDIEEDGWLRVRQRGDFNDNDRIDIGDVARVAYMAVGLFPDDPEARFEGEDQVTPGDAAKIAYYYVGEIHEL